MPIIELSAGRTCVPPVMEAYQAPYYLFRLAAKRTLAVKFTPGQLVDRALDIQDRISCESDLILPEISNSASSHQS